MGIKSCLSLLSLVFCCTPAIAEHRPATLTSEEAEIVQSPFFAETHPDIRWRLSALDNIEQGLHVGVMGELLLAARFGDKPAQAMVAEAYWKGLYQQPVDRALAYAWMDLAAERGYRPLLVQREIYWRELTESERKSAIERGAEVYDEYGDDVALPRLETKLREGRSRKTGSRVGAGSVNTQTIAAGASRVVINLSVPISPIVDPSIGSLGTMHPQVSGAKRIRLWEDKYWDLDRYLAWKEVTIDADLSGIKRGEVDVLPLEVLAKDQ